MSVNGIDDLGYLPLKGNSAKTKVMTGPIWFNNDIFRFCIKQHCINNF